MCVKLSPKSFSRMTVAHLIGCKRSKAVLAGDWWMIERPFMILRASTLSGNNGSRNCGRKRPRSPLADKGDPSTLVGAKLLCTTNPSNSSHGCYCGCEDTPVILNVSRSHALMTTTTILLTLADLKMLKQTKTEEGRTVFILHFVVD